MSPRALLSFSIAASLALVVATGCTEKTVSGEQERLAPLPLAELSWGADLNASEAMLAKRNFRRVARESADEAHFTFQPPEVDTENLPGVNPYEITLFARENKLVAARYIRRDIPENLKGYSSTLTAGNELKEAWEGAKTVTHTPAGNKITEQTVILENADFLVKNTLTNNDGAEERFAAGLNDELETQIYARQHNEGISVDRLKPEAQ